MKDPIVIKLQIIAEKGGPWSNLYAFERDLADFFAAYGKEAIAIENIKGQSSAELMIFVKQTDPIREGTLNNKVNLAKAKVEGAKK